MKALMDLFALQERDIEMPIEAYQELADKLDTLLDDSRNAIAPTAGKAGI